MQVSSRSNGEEYRKARSVSDISQMSVWSGPRVAFGTGIASLLVPARRREEKDSESQSGPISMGSRLQVIDELTSWHSAHFHPTNNTPSIGTTLACKNHHASVPEWYLADVLGAHRAAVNAF